MGKRGRDFPRLCPLCFLAIDWIVREGCGSKAAKGEDVCLCRAAMGGIGFCSTGEGK